MEWIGVVLLVIAIIAIVGIYLTFSFEYPFLDYAIAYGGGFLFLIIVGCVSLFKGEEEEKNGVDESSSPLQDYEGGGEPIKLPAIASIVPITAIVLILLALFSASASGDLHGIK